MSAEKHPLTAAVDGERCEVQGPVGPVSYYRSRCSESVDAQPLLLVHSVNAAASAYEMSPLFEHYGRHRPVYALELPGFGFSARPDHPYSARTMTDAVAAVIETIRAAHDGKAVSVVALSLGCEFVARAACETPDAFASVALINPTAMDGATPRRGPPGSDRGIGWLYRFFRLPLWSEVFFAMLTTRPSIRFFLRKTFGSKAVPQAMIDYAWLTSHQPGARFAPYRFVTGYLFSGDAFSLYEALAMPVWMGNGEHGDFADHRLSSLLEERGNWTVASFDSGAMPHFQCPDEFIAGYGAFLDRVDA